MAYLCFSNLIVAVKATDNIEFITDIITPLFIKKKFIFLYYLIKKYF